MRINRKSCFHKISSISIFLFCALITSCNQDEKNIKWLIENHDGNIQNILGDEITCEYASNYVYITSEKQKHEYGYLFMDRKYFNGLYENIINESLENYDNSLLIIQGKVRDKKQFNSVVSFISEFRHKRIKEYIPYLVKINEKDFKFKFYEMYHRTKLEDTVIQW